MNKLNAVGKPREYWRVLPIVPGDMLAAMAQQAEADGMTGLFSYQVYGPPFIPLAAAATATSTIKLASGVAVTASRSPFETAMAARDLDTISGGRFTLGLGSSTPSVVDKIYGVKRVKPLQHVRETVAAVRHIHENAHGQLSPFNGDYYQADFTEIDALTPPVKAHLPIWLGALREKMTRLAIEVGDGLIGHPMWSVEWALNHIRPMIEDELQKCARKRDEIEINLWLWAAPGTDKKQAIADARDTVAFYAGMKAYESYFSALGFEKEVHRLQSGENSAAIPDEMVQAFVAVGHPDQVRERIEAVWQFADSICVLPPIYNISDEKQGQYAGMIADIFKPDV